MQVTEIVQTLAGGDEIKANFRPVEPICDFSRLELIVNAAAAREIDHLGREVHPNHARRPRLETDTGEARAAAEVENAEVPEGLSRCGLDQVPKTFRRLIIQLVAHQRFIV